MPHFGDHPRVLVEEITDLPQLEALQPQWWDLWQRDQSATPFQSPAWLLPWWRHIGKGELLGLAIRPRPESSSNNHLVCFLPLYIYTQPDSCSRDLFPLGIATTDYLDGLFAPGWEHCATVAALKYLAEKKQRWNVFDMPQLRADSPMLSAPAPESWAAEIDEAECCPTLPLPKTWEEFEACASRHLLHNISYYQRRLEKIGTVRIDRATDSDIAIYFDALIELQRKRWTTRGQDGCLTDPAVQAAHRESLPMLMAKKMLRLYGLRLNERIIAVMYGLADPPPRAHRRFSYYLAAFDPDYDSASPGTLLIAHAVRECINDGIETFDFLRGREAYKYLWGARDQKTFRRRLWHSPQSLDIKLTLTATIREARKADLPTLEWFGLFNEDLIRQQFERQLRGSTIMLVAEVNGVPSAQAWIELSRKNIDSTGVIWAVRVFPTLQGKGIGTRLMQAAENILRDRCFRRAELAVEKPNLGALRLYERLGYQITDVASDHQWILRKRLKPETAEDSSAYPGQETRDANEKSQDRNPMDDRRRQRSRI